MRYSKDIKRYTTYSGGLGITAILTQQGLWALAVYRFYNRIYRSKLPWVFKKPILFFGVLAQKWIEITTGITLPYSATIGPGLYIGHHSGIILNANTKMGSGCNISQGVTIGVSGRGEKRGVPVIGNNVYIGPNAVVAGPIFVGDHVVIGANSVVTKDIDSGVTVRGVPAIVVSNKDSKGYV